MSKNKNYIYNIIYRVSICVLPLVVTPYISRVLGSENNGLYAYSSCIACYFILFAKLGIENYGNRTIASCLGTVQDRSRLFWGIYCMQLITSFASFAVYMVLTFTVFKGQLVLYLFQGIYVANAFFDVSWYFYGIGEFKYPSIRSVVIRVFIIIGVFAFVKTEQDILPYTFVMSFCFLLEQVLLLPKLFKSVSFVRIGFSDIKKHFMPNLYLFLPLVALSVYNWMDKLMIGMMTDNSEVAFYNYADSIINLPKGIVAAIGTVMMPRIANMVARNDYSKYKEEVLQSSKLVCFICCALCFGISGVASVFIPVFLGPGYEKTSLLTISLAVVMIPLSFIDILQNQYLIPFKKEKYYTRSVVYGAIVNLVLNLLFIPRLASFGAVIGTLGAELVVFLVQLWYSREYYPPKYVFKSLLPFIPCGVAELAAIKVTEHFCSSMNVFVLLILEVAAGGLAYLVCSLPVMKNEISELLGKRK